MKNRILISLIGLAFLLTGGLSVPAGVFAGDVNVNIGIGVGVPPPQVVIPAPPGVVLIPGTHVYFAPDVGVQLFFYSGYWFSLHDGYWFWANDYIGPWYYLPPARIPVAFLHLPPHYYKISPGYKRIPYEQLKRNWREWDKSEYKEVKGWEKDIHKQWKERDEGWKQWKGSKGDKGGTEGRKRDKKR
jgi:hypothetical protein